ncbi:MAG: hypothetical protein ABFC80_03830 [Coriobacteriales bacterium]
MNDDDPTTERCEIPSGEGYVLSVPNSVADDFKRAIERASLTTSCEEAVIIAAHRYAMLDEYLHTHADDESDEVLMLMIARDGLHDIVRGFGGRMERLPDGELKTWGRKLGEVAIDQEMAGRHEMHKGGVA